MFPAASHPARVRRDAEPAPIGPEPTYREADPPCPVPRSAGGMGGFPSRVTQTKKNSGGPGARFAGAFLTEAGTSLRRLTSARTIFVSHGLQYMSYGLSHGHNNRYGPVPIPVLRGLRYNPRRCCHMVSYGRDHPDRLRGPQRVSYTPLPPLYTLSLSKGYRIL